MAVVTFSWLNIGHSKKEGLQSALKDEFTQIGLVSALMMTVIAQFVGFSATLPDISGTDWEAWKKHVCGILWTISFLFTAYALFQTVIFLMAINEMKDDDQLKRFCELQGKLLLMPAQMLLVGVIFMVLAYILWYFLNFSLSSFLVILVVGVVSLIPHQYVIVATVKHVFLSRT
jgi:hypothetical protein